MSRSREVKFKLKTVMEENLDVFIAGRTMAGVLMWGLKDNKDMLCHFAEE